MKKAGWILGFVAVFGLVAGGATLEARETTETKEKRTKKIQKTEPAPAAAVPAAAPAAADGKVVFHGNVKTKALHPPCSPDYNCKNCTATFASLEEGTKAGYKEVKCAESKKKK